MIYLDHAATSWPKPREVLRAMNDFLDRAGGNPGRSGHRLSVEAGRIVYEVRESVAEFFNMPDPMRVVFTQNGTHAINIALAGFLKPGDAVVTSSIEHNSVMRPLRALDHQGVVIKIVDCSPNGEMDLSAFEQALAEGAKLLAVTHAGNVIGGLSPISELARIAHCVGALIFVDAAQTAGIVPIDVQKMGIDFLAFTGHKGLQGPPGVGGLVIGERIDIKDVQPLLRGGTGSRSESEEQPDFLPDKFESGTPNGVGIAGLGAALQWITERGVDNIRAHEARISVALVEGLSAIPGVTVYGPHDAERRVPVVSFRIEGHAVSEVGMQLDEEFDVLCRVGLHCAPAGHKTIGTFPEGTVRFAAGPLTTDSEIGQAIAAVAEIANR